MSYQSMHLLSSAIHRAAGPELKEACAKVPEVRPGVRCPTGEARITPYVHCSHAIFILQSLLL